jgi:hypothetical protein
MQQRSVIPPIPNILNFDSSDLGSLDPLAFRRQFPEYTRRSNPYDEISKLSMRAESLKQENEILKLELLDLVTANEADPYFRLKKHIIEFGIQLTRREKEVDEVIKHVNESSLTASPTFVEVSVHRRRHASFDLVATSLLVSNEQRHFFTAPDLRHQNEELFALIEHQEEGLRKLRSQLNVFSAYHHSNSIRAKMEALRNGETPALVAPISPADVLEQRVRIKLLRAELADLVAQRLEGQPNRIFKRQNTAIEEPDQKASALSNPRLRKISAKAPEQEEAKQSEDDGSAPLASENAQSLASAKRVNTPHVQIALENASVAETETEPEKKVDQTEETITEAAEAEEELSQVPESELPQDDVPVDNEIAVSGASEAESQDDDLPPEIPAGPENEISETQADAPIDFPAGSEQTALDVPESESPTGETESETPALIDAPAEAEPDATPGETDDSVMTLDRGT